MKALILAAGLGTRLRPYTQHTPKPLFPFGGRPLLDILIRRLAAAGCEAVAINTHHLPGRIRAFLAGQDYPVAVHTRHEPRLLGTGGTIRHLADFFDGQPFLVINGDVYTDLDLRAFWRRHISHPHPATLAVHDHPAYNSVAVSPDGFVTAFADRPGPAAKGWRTFTGIQALDPVVMEYIPPQSFYNSIDAYRAMLADGLRLKAFDARRCCWKDIGTPGAYRAAAFDMLAAEAFRKAYTDPSKEAVACTPLPGDGSDRSWYRLRRAGRTLVLADHGIRTGLQTAEVDAFVAIGRHLAARGVPVPAIHAADTFSGLVIMEDLGDTNLQSLVRSASNRRKILAAYTAVVDALVNMALRGAEGFDPQWTYQSGAYDRRLILERECRYFIEAFAAACLDTPVSYEMFADEFAYLADGALANAVGGFMHRDLQSRNIMCKDGRFFFIDFQGGRIGPVQYDLASLLIDPYTELPSQLKAHLLEHCLRRLQAEHALSAEVFRTGYRFCALCRNLQALGAFGFLSRVRGKRTFERYIGPGLSALQQNLAALGRRALPGLSELAGALDRRWRSGRGFAR